MVFDDASMRRQDAAVSDPTGAQARYGGEPGFRDEPDFRAPSAYPGGRTDVEHAAAVPAPALDDVFDDPDGGAPGRDRLGVHWAWELLLLLGVVSLVALVWQADSAALRGDNLSQVLVTASAFGLLGIAAGVTLRAGAPNLAIGPVAAAAGVYFAQQGADGITSVTMTAVVTAGALGAALAVLVVGLHVPGWAASLAAAGGVVVWLQQQPAEVPLAGEFDPGSQAAFLFMFVVALAVLGGMLGTVKPLRRALGGFRPVGDPAQRRGMLAAVMAGSATVLSMCLAAVAGILLAAGEGAPVAGSGGTRWLELTVIGVAVALVGGTSAFGRRGGVFGTTLAVLALVLFDTWQELEGWGVALLAAAAVALVGGLLITRLVELMGRPRPGDGDDWLDADAEPGAAAGSRASDMWGAGADSWTSALPAQPARDHPNPWDDRWAR